jgi:hypothetical protein
VTALTSSPASRLEKPAKVARVQSRLLLSGEVMAFLPDDANKRQQADILRQVRHLAKLHIVAPPPRLGWLEGRRIVQVAFVGVPWRVLRGLEDGIAELTGCPLGKVYQLHRQVLP